MLSHCGQATFDQHQCLERFKMFEAQGGKNEISIPFAWLVWYVGPQMEMVRPVLASISDPALRAALQEAHAERLGLWVAVWPVTMLVLSQILEWKMEE